LIKLTISLVGDIYSRRD